MQKTIDTTCAGVKTGKDVERRNNIIPFRHSHIGHIISFFPLCPLP